MSNAERSDEPLSKSGARVRAQLLDAAGEVFAELGFQGATSRDICARAGVNSAAVNYHFGGFDALYVATLKEAHRRVHLVAPFDVQDLKGKSAKERLRALIRNLVTRMSQSAADSWEVRLVSRELVIPTFAQAEFVSTSIEPRRAYLKSLVGEILERPPQDPLVGRCLFTVIAPCIMLSIVNKPSLDALLPDMGNGSEGTRSLVDHVERFIFAGLDAVKRDLSRESRKLKIVHSKGVRRRSQLV